MTGGSSISKLHIMNEQVGSRRQMGDVACRIEALSWRPRASVYHNFMSEEECDHILNMTRAHVGAPPPLKQRHPKRNLSRGRSLHLSFYKN